MELEEREVSVIRKKGREVKSYYNHETNNFILDEDIIGLDTNILVDMAAYKDFKEEVKDQLSFGVLKIYTTEIALGEARHALVTKKGFKDEEATEKLKNLLTEISIEKIDHQEEYDELGDYWVSIVKKKTFIKKFDTFPNDCKILANLYKQKRVNFYFTEDKDIKKAVKILKLKIRVKIIAEASNLNKAKLNNFFRENYKIPYKKRKRF